MKERLVEDWLSRINERGYEVPFCQTLIAKGYRVVRCGHSPIEHGKDVIAIAPDGLVYCYQLKSGDVAQTELAKHLPQLNMLVEARPSHPSLPADFKYCPVLVTTGEYSPPAVSLVKELNGSWKDRSLPELALIGGRQLLAELVSLSDDFWPVDAPALRQFRELYLVDGRGDLEVAQFAKFIAEIVGGLSTPRELERKSAAANLFASYLLGPFYEEADHWSIFRGWIVCAGAIARAGAQAEHDSVHWFPSFELARNGGLTALRALRDEALGQDAFRVYQREVDDYTRVRNTITMAAAACAQLIDQIEGADTDPDPILDIIADFVTRGRFFFWGERAFSSFSTIIWLLDTVGLSEQANALLMSVVQSVSERNHPESEEPYDDPYDTEDESIIKLLGREDSEGNRSNRRSVQSYSLLPLVLLAARRNLRSQLEALWPRISHVRLTRFRADAPIDLLSWHCDKGREEDLAFEQPQSWQGLREVALRDDSDRLPAVIRDDPAFALMFAVAYPHRILLSLTKYLDEVVVPASANQSKQ